MSKRVVVVGCGEAGLETSIRLKKKVGDEAEVVVVSEDGFFTYRPWLRKFFRGGKHEDVAVNLDFLLSDHGVRFVESAVEDLDLEGKKVVLEDGAEEFDFLVLALDSIPDHGSFTGVPNVVDYHSTEDVERIKDEVKKVLSDEASDNTVVVCGGGPAGVELTYELNEFLESCCDEEGVRRIDVKLMLLEREKSLLPSFPLKARSFVEEDLGRNGVDVRTRINVGEVKEGGVVTDKGSVNADLVVWCGGVKSDPLLKGHKVHTDPENRVIVNSYLQSVTDAMIYAVGAGANPRHVTYKGPEVSGLGNAVRQAKVAAHNLASNIHGGEKEEFEFRKTPVWISLGRGKSLMAWGNFVLKGWFADFLNGVREKRFVNRWK